VKTSNPTSAVSICKEDKNAEQQAKLQEDWASIIKTG
jgi:hypothetical protein